MSCTSSMTGPVFWPRQIICPKNPLDDQRNHYLFNKNYVYFILTEKLFYPTDLPPTFMEELRDSCNYMSLDNDAKKRLKTVYKEIMLFDIS